MTGLPGLAAVAALTLTLSAAAPAAAQASFTVLPQVTGVTGANTAHGISADGSTVSGTTFGPTQAFRWNATIGTVPLFPVMPFISVAYDLSADGSVIVGTLTTSDFGMPPFMNEAFRWTQAGGLEHLGSLPGGSSESNASAISDDGAIIIGSSSSDLGTEVFRWTAAEGMVGLGIQPGWTTSGGRGISADGTTIVGGSSTPGFPSEAFYWTEAAGFVGIGTLLAPDPGAASASAASADGSVIVGESNSPDGLQAFRWTEEGGMVGLGDLPGGTFQSLAFAVSGDGSIVVGESDAGGSGRDAFLWHESHGMRLLIDVLEERGLDMTGWRIRTATGISNDGTTITGSARDPSNQTKSYVAVIPEPEQASLLLAGALALVFLRRRRDPRRRA